MFVMQISGQGIFFDADPKLVFLRRYLENLELENELHAA